MRKNELRRYANNQLNNDNHGSYRDRKYRHFVITTVIHDLFKLKQCPAIWHGLTSDHVRALVFQWTKQKIKPATIMKYMTVIRYFLQRIEHRLDGVDNQSLGITRIKPQSKQASISKDILDESIHPIARVIFELQSGFGLTFSEATRLIPDIHLREHSIWLTREIAFNSQDRVIPVRDDKQLITLQSLCQLTNNNRNLTSAHGYHAVREIYQTSTQGSGLTPTRSCRHLYAKQQFYHLSQALSHREATLIIMREMGLKSRTTLWGYLHE